MSFQWCPSPPFRHEVRRVFVDPDLPLVARVDEVVVERAQQDAVLNVASSVVAFPPVDVVRLGPCDRCGAAGECATTIPSRQSAALGAGEPALLATEVE